MRISNAKHKNLSKSLSSKLKRLAKTHLSKTNDDAYIADEVRRWFGRMQASRRMTYWHRTESMIDVLYAAHIMCSLTHAHAGRERERAKLIHVTVDSLNAQVEKWFVPTRRKGDRPSNEREWEKNTYPVHMTDGLYSWHNALCVCVCEGFVRKRK